MNEEAANVVISLNPEAKEGTYRFQLTLADDNELNPKQNDYFFNIHISSYEIATGS